MEHYSLTSLMIVVSAAFLVPIVLHKLKLRVLPVVVAEIVVGLIIGKSGFDLVSEDLFLELLSLLGFIYLMFLSGVEIDFSVFKSKRSKAAGAEARRNGERSGRRKVGPFTVAMLMFAGIISLSYVLSLMLVAVGLVEEPVLMTIIIATISLGVVVPVLKEKRIIETELGQTLLLVTVISDFVTMIMLAVYISWLSGSTAKMLLLLLFFVLVVAVYLTIRRVAGRAVFKLLSQGTVQIGTRAVFALILLFVVLSERLGAENILGAFLAGVVVALIAPKKDFIHRLDSFGYGFLIPIFFVMIGVKMELWSLFSDWKIVLLIPLLLCCIFISKMVPALLLRWWYGWRETLGSGILLASTLSLVIAASTIANELGLIDDATHGAFILVAVLSCLVFPVWFNKIFPEQAPSRRQTIAIVAANHVTIPVSQNLDKTSYDVKLYSTDKQDPQQVRPVSAVEVSGLTIDALSRQGAFDANTVVLGSMDDELNVSLARHANSFGVKRVIVRIEEPRLQQQLREEGFVVFSTLHAATTLMKAVIEHPAAVELVTGGNDSIREAYVGNPAFDGVQLRSLPLSGDALILRIYRDESFIVPNGNTELRLGDRLLLSGEPEAIYTLRQEIE